MRVYYQFCQRRARPSTLAYRLSAVQARAGMHEVAYVRGILRASGFKTLDWIFLSRFPDNYPDQSQVSFGTFTSPRFSEV